MNPIPSSTKPNGNQYIQRARKNVIDQEGKAFCRYCGNKNPSDSMFCEKCGKKIG